MSIEKNPSIITSAAKGAFLIFVIFFFSLLISSLIWSGLMDTLSQRYSPLYMVLIDALNFYFIRCMLMALTCSVLVFGLLYTAFEKAGVSINKNLNRWQILIFVVIFVVGPLFLFFLYDYLFSHLYTFLNLKGQTNYILSAWDMVQRMLFICLLLAILSSWTYKFFFTKHLVSPGDKTINSTRLTTAIFAGIIFWISMVYLAEFIREAQFYKVLFSGHHTGEYVLQKLLARQWNIYALVVMLYVIAFALAVYFFVYDNRRSVHPWRLFGIVVLGFFILLMISRTMGKLKDFDYWMSNEGILISLLSGLILSFIAGAATAFILNITSSQTSVGNSAETS